jgi:hypothetical protein
LFAITFIFGFTALIAAQSPRLAEPKSQTHVVHAT